MVVYRLLSLQLLAFALVTSILPTTLVTAGGSSDYVRGCYYTNWAQYRPGKGKYMPENYVPGLCTHIFYAFAVMTQDFQIKPFEWNDESTEWSKGMYERVNDLKKLQPDLKVLLSFGGWTFSQGNLQLMSTLVSSPENRRRFIDSVVTFVRKHKFDGFDVDFEYPSAKDKENFAKFIGEMKEAFENESKKTKKERLLLTAAVAAGFDKTDGYDVPYLAKCFDFMNVMTYDFHGAWEQVTGMNSPLYDRNGDRYAISNAMNYWVEKGAPKQKLMVGFSSYGRGWTLRNANSTQIGAPTNGPAQALQYTREGGVGTYYEMCDLLESGATKHQDDRTKGPYLVKGNQWFGYDDEQSFKAKLKWLKENGFGGAFTWALDMDDFTGQCKSAGGKKYPLHLVIKEELTRGQVIHVTKSKENSNEESSNIPVTMSTVDSVGSTDPETSSPPPQQSTTSAISDPSVTSSSPGSFSSFSSSTSFISSSSPSSPSAAFTCPGTGIYALPGKCDSFYLCADGGTAYVQSCPVGLLYNNQVSACDWPQNVQCKELVTF